MKTKLIIYDGLCHLCNSSVMFIIRNSDSCPYYFVSFQSEHGMRLCDICGIDNIDPDSFILISNGSVFIKSDAWVYILMNLNSFWGFLGAILKFIPRFIRDGFYDFIGKHRYKVFGKYDACKIDDELINKNMPDDIRINMFIDMIKNKKKQ